ncbi:unnamed protein product [Mytilus coruscus]|uniref:Integrase zinc-binding domain-containing protein n=1 Tax=Mytilus coruscus TaxID=42192 RepID=A0A6J8D6N2_MYTCO|nr:unnamed protein product [Mytilus coruscus]
MLNWKTFLHIQNFLRVTCILMRIVTTKSFKGASIGITAESLNAAELEWIRYLQRDISDDWTKTFRRLSPEKNEAGIVVVGKRLADWLKATWNKTDLMLLPNKGHYVWLYLNSVHDQDHAGVDVTLAKVRSKFWIPKVRKSISMIRKRSVICRRRDNKCIGQQMGPLPLERLQP